MTTNVRTLTCRYCGRVLPVDSFPIKPGYVRARYKECAECHALGHSCIPKEKPKRVRRTFANDEERKAAQQEYQRMYREQHREELKQKRQEYRTRKADMNSKSADRFFCSCCGSVKPSDDFITDGRQYKVCNACRGKHVKRSELGKKPKGPHGTSSRCDYHRQYYEAHKDAIKERRCTELSVSIDTATDRRIIGMYKKGYSLNDISSRCMVSMDHVREVIERDGCKTCEVRLCCDCWLYPCFDGMEVISSNLALTCQKYHRKEAAS